MSTKFSMHVGTLFRDSMGGESNGRVWNLISCLSGMRMLGHSSLDAEHVSAWKAGVIASLIDS